MMQNRAGRYINNFLVDFAYEIIEIYVENSVFLSNEARHLVIKGK